ncbi:MAG: M1 family peptidase [Anaerolineae bacterium]|nr:MAG: M1 family peptidase [Anaerolineae bacterium]
MTRATRFNLSLITLLLLTSLACQTVLAPLAGGRADDSPTPETNSPTTSPTAATSAEEDAPVEAGENCGVTAEPVEDGELEANPAHTSIGDPYAPELGNQGYDVQRYTLALSLDPARPRQVCGTVTIEATATEAIEEFGLDFIGFGIQSLTVNGVEAETYRTPGKVVILLDAPLAAGDDFEVKIHYGGLTEQVQSRFAPFEDSLGLFFPSEQNLYALSEPDGSRYWFPCNDHPRDKALFRFEITTPGGLMAVANGLLKDEIDNGDTTTWVWEHADPMAPYLATVAVGDYAEVQNEVVNGVALRSYALPSAASTLEIELERTAEAIGWMEEMVGSYPFEAYGYVTVESFGVTLENQSMVVLSIYMINEAVMVHELAHMWFGDHVSLDTWGDMWRNEGFATYFEYLWGYRDDPSGFDAEMDALVNSIDRNTALEPLTDLTPANLFGYESYVKGAALLHALRGEVGDTAFFKGLRLYLERFGGGTATNADFIAVMEEASGSDLEAFFDLWLNK